MSLQIRRVKILQDLGLTLPQAKVYLAIARIGDGATVKEITAASNVFRQDVYSTLTELQEIGLIERIVDKKATYRVIPVKVALKVLAERNIKKINGLKVEAAEAFKHSGYPEKVASYKESNMFILIPKKEVVKLRLKSAIEKTQNIIRVLAPCRELIQSMFMLHDEWKQALNNGVTVYWIINKINYNN